MDLVKDSKPSKTVASPSKPKPTRKESAAEIVDMERRGMKLPEIKAITGKSVSSISQILKRAGVKHTALTQFREDRSAILETVQMETLDALLNRGKIDQMSGKDLMLACAIAIDKQRLLDGHSASGGNISLLVIANRVHQEYQSGKLKGGEVVVTEAEVVSPPPETVAEDGDYV